MPNLNEYIEAAKNNRFQKGSGVFTCECCGKKTRDVGGNAANGLCGYCLEEGEWENALSDGDITEEEYERKIEALKKKYKR